MLCSFYSTQLDANESTFGIYVVHNSLLNFPSLLPGDIIFNAQYPELPPDFIFGEDAEFLPEPSELRVSIYTHVKVISCKFFCKTLKCLFQNVALFYSEYVLNFISLLHKKTHLPHDLFLLCPTC